MRTLPLGRLDNASLVHRCMACGQKLGEVFVQIGYLRNDQVCAFKQDLARYVPGIASLYDCKNNRGRPSCSCKSSAQGVAENVEAIFGRVMKYRVNHGDPSFHPVSALAAICKPVAKVCLLRHLEDDSCLRASETQRRFDTDQHDSLLRGGQRCCRLVTLSFELCQFRVRLVSRCREPVCSAGHESNRNTDAHRRNYAPPIGDVAPVDRKKLTRHSHVTSPGPLEWLDPAPSAGRPQLEAA